MEELDALVSEFTGKVVALLTQRFSAAMDGLHPTANATRPTKGRVAKRNNEELDTLGQKVFRLIQDNPGTSVESMNKVLGTVTKDLARPIKQLLAEKAIKTEGQRRGTRYFPKK